MWPRAQAQPMPTWNWGLVPVARLMEQWRFEKGDARMSVWSPPPVPLWTEYLNSLCLGFLIRQMGITDACFLMLWKVNKTEHGEAPQAIGAWRCVTRQGCELKMHPAMATVQISKHMFPEN